VQAGELHAVDLAGSALTIDATIWSEVSGFILARVRQPPAGLRIIDARVSPENSCCECVGARRMRGPRSGDARPEHSDTPARAA